MSSEEHNPITDALLMLALNRCRELASWLDVNHNLIDTPYHDGNTLLHYASDYNSKCIELLLENGANPKVVNDKGETPLHIAARREHFKIVDLLCMAGSDVNAKDRKNWTPLHHLAMNPNYLDEDSDDEHSEYSERSERSKHNEIEDSDTKDQEVFRDVIDDLAGAPVITGCHVKENNVVRTYKYLVDEGADTSIIASCGIPDCCYVTPAHIAFSRSKHDPLHKLIITDHKHPRCEALFNLR